MKSLKDMTVHGKKNRRRHLMYAYELELLAEKTNYSHTTLRTMLSTNRMSVEQILERARKNKRLKLDVELKLNGKSVAEKLKIIKHAVLSNTSLQIISGISDVKSLTSRVLLKCNTCGEHVHRRVDDILAEPDRCEDCVSQKRSDDMVVALDKDANPPAWFALIWMIIERECKDLWSPMFKGTHLHFYNCKDMWLHVRDKEGCSSENTIDMIDITLGYRPGNVKWVAKKTQQTLQRKSA